MVKRLMDIIKEEKERLSTIEAEKRSGRMLWYLFHFSRIGKYGTDVP